jgi:hypothetical protein
MYFAAFSTFLCPVTASPLVDTGSDILKQRQNIDWSFLLYQNARCTGAEDPYSRFGSVPCTGGIRNGNPVAYQKRFVDAGCTIGFYDDNGCNSPIDLINETNDTGCHTPVQGGAIIAYDVVC